MDVLHTAIWVNDIDSVTAFYCDGLGLEHTRDFVGDDGVTNYFVGGESDAEIQFKFDDTERDLDPSGIDHLAVAVSDIEGTLDTLVEEYGSELISGPTDSSGSGSRIAFATDPSGYVVELIQPADD